MKKGKIILRDTLIILGITLGMLVLIEVTLRVIYPRDSFKAEKISYRYDSVLLITLQPSIDRTYTRDAIDGGEVIRWKINAEGFRHGPMRKGAKRIMVYGDSNVQGVFSEDDNTFCARLEVYLSDSCRGPVEVINAGTVGYGPDQSLLKFQRDLPLYHPDEAVFVIFGHNDYGDLIRNRLFELDADSNLVITTHERELDPLLKKPGILQDMRIIEIVKRVRGKLGLDRKMTPEEIGELTMKQYEELCSIQFDQYRNKGANLYSHFFDNYDIDVATRPESEQARVKTRLMKEIIRAIAATARMNNIPVSLVVLPSAIDLTFNRSVSSRNLQQYPAYHQANLTQPVVRAARELNVSALDLFQHYSAEDPSLLYFRGEFNDHWTDYAQDLAARLTASMICNAH